MMPTGTKLCQSHSLDSSRYAFWMPSLFPRHDAAEMAIGVLAVLAGSSLCMPSLPHDYGAFLLFEDRTRAHWMTVTIYCRFLNTLRAVIPWHCCVLLTAAA